MTAAKDFLKQLNEAIAGSFRHARSHKGCESPEKAKELIKRRIERSYELLTQHCDSGTLNDGLAEVFSHDRLQRDVESITDTVANAAASGDPLLFAFQIALDEFHSIVAKATLQLPTVPTVGSLPVGEMNAWTMRVPNTEDCVIVVHTGLALFLNRMLKIVLSIHSLTDRQAYDVIDRSNDNWTSEFTHVVEQAIARDGTYEKHFVLTLLFYLIAGDPNLAPPIHESPLVTPIRAHILHYTEMFVVGHEYAHIAMGHVDASAAKRCMALGRHEMVACDWSHQQEFDADLMSINLIAAHSAERFLDKVPPLHFMNISGGDFFLGCADLMDEALSDVRGKRLVAATHPAATERRRLIKSSLDEITQCDSTIYAQEYQTILDVLYKRSKQFMVECFRQGASLSPIWQPERTSEQGG